MALFRNTFSEVEYMSPRLQMTLSWTKGLMTLEHVFSNPEMPIKFPRIGVGILNSEL